MESDRKASSIATPVLTHVASSSMSIGLLPNHQPQKVLQAGPGTRKYREHGIDKSGVGVLGRWKRWNQRPNAPVVFGRSQSRNPTDHTGPPAYSGIAIKLSPLPWTPADDQILFKLRKLGISFQTIQEVHFPQRTVRACSSRFHSPTFRTQFSGTNWDRWSRKHGSVVRLLGKAPHMNPAIREIAPWKSNLN